MVGKCGFFKGAEFWRLGGEWAVVFADGPHGLVSQSKDGGHYCVWQWWVVASVGGTMAYCAGMAFFDEFGLLRVLVVLLPGSFCSQNCPFRITVEFGGLLRWNDIDNIRMGS